MLAAEVTPFCVSDYSTVHSNNETNKFLFLSLQILFF
jgi:hypothetical protein